MLNKALVGSALGSVAALCELTLVVYAPKDVCITFLGAKAQQAQ